MSSLVQRPYIPVKILFQLFRKSKRNIITIHYRDCRPLDLTSWMSILVSDVHAVISTNLGIEDKREDQIINEILTTSEGLRGGRPLTSLLGAEVDQTYAKQPEIWTVILTLWNRAAKLYSEKVAQIKTEDEIFPISFNRFLTVAEDFRRKRLGAHFQLQQVDGQVSLNNLLRFGHQLFHRTATEASKKATGAKQARLMMLLDRIQKNYEAGLESIKVISTNIDFAQLKIKGCLDAGPAGKLQLTAKDIMAQLPILLSFHLMKEKNLGHAPIVPYITSIKPQENGDLLVEVSTLTMSFKFFQMYRRYIM